MEYRILELSAVTPDALRRWFSEADAPTQARLRSLKRPQAQMQSLAADHLARQMLFEACGAADISIRRDASGKPYAALPLQFSLSHSGDFVACAIHGGAVGVDIEAIREIPIRTARYVCTEREWAYLHAGGAYDSARFLRVWTAKEAFLKYLGCGLCRPPREVETVGADGLLAIPGHALFTEQTDRYVLSVIS